MQVISVLRVTETVAGFNGDLLWAAVDSVDKGGRIRIFCRRLPGVNDGRVRLWLTVAELKR